MELNLEGAYLADDSCMLLDTKSSLTLPRVVADDELEADKD